MLPAPVWNVTLTREQRSCKPSIGPGKASLLPFLGVMKRATTIGKKNQINNFCIGIQGNWAQRTTCHIGYGWDDAEYFDTATDEDIDCLVCHDQSGAYAKRAVW